MAVESQRTRGKAEPPIHPKELARALEASIRSDHETRTLLPQDRGAQVALARWGRALGLEAELGLEKGERADWRRLADLVAERISPHPARFEELAAAAQEFEAYMLRREGKQLEGCGTPWGRVVRLFWRDRAGRLVMRQRGIHSCKHRWCPRCGKPRQNRLANEIERCVELARAWGFGEENLRFLTLTVENGVDIPSLREKAHESWARLQRTRWWPRQVFGWFRGTEVVTGQDGNWNLHLHVVLVLWSHQISYSALWDAWEAAVGERCQIDVDELRDLRKKARGRGTTRAARYIVKYITKREVLGSLRKGPGGLAHLFTSTRRLRAFAVGGGCSVLRRLLPVLMPHWALRAERALAGAELRDGLPPVAAEEVDPETGEALPIAPPEPFPDPQERAAWTTLAAKLADETGTVGQRCGPRGRFRRIGAVPLPSRAPTIDQWDRAQRAARKARPGLVAMTHLRWTGRGGSRRPVPLRVAVRSAPLHVERGALLTGIRSVIAGEVGWKAFVCENKVQVYTKDAAGKKVATGQHRTRTFRAILPAARYAWKWIAAAVWRALLGDRSPWGRLRRAAFRAWADGKVEPYARENHLRAAAAALDDRVTLRFEGMVLRTTRRELHGAELMRQFVQTVQRDSKAVWSQAVMNLRRHALALEGPGLIGMRNESEEARELRAIVEAEAGF